MSTAFIKTVKMEKKKRLCASTAVGTGLVPSRGNRILHNPEAWPKYIYIYLLHIKHGGPLPSSYYVLHALTVAQRDQFCYWPHFIEEEIWAQEIKPLIQGQSTSD